MSYGDRSDTKKIFFNVNKGAFKFRLSKEDEYKYCTYVSGAFASMEIRYKPGNGGDVRGHDSLLVKLQATEEGQSFEYFIDCHFPSNWATMFAGYLDHVAAGEQIRIETWGSPQNEKVSFCAVKLSKGSEWVDCPRRKDAPKVDNDELARLVAAAKTPREKEAVAEDYRKSVSLAKEAWAGPIIRNHEAFVEVASDSDDDEGEPSAPAPEKKEEQTTKPPSIFEWTPQRWPAPEKWKEEAPASQFNAAQKAIQEFYEPKDCRDVFEAVAREAGYPIASDEWVSRGLATLVYDFFKSGQFPTYRMKVDLAIKKDAATGGSQAIAQSTNEYDPFADE